MPNPITKIIHGFTAVFEPSVQGGFAVYVSELAGCYTQGESLKEAANYAKQAIEGHLLTLEKAKGGSIVDGQKKMVLSLPTHSNHLKPETVKRMAKDTGLPEEQFMNML
jgi:predicted RNase H-like HicB family nuclease